MATNTVTVIGNLVEDPELRFTPSGVAMAKIRVRRQPTLARQEQRLAGRHKLLRGNRLARCRRECRRVAAEGREGDSSPEASSSAPGKRPTVIDDRSLNSASMNLAPASAGRRPRSPARREAATVIGVEVAAEANPSRCRLLRSPGMTTAPTKRLSRSTRSKEN